MRELRRGWFGKRAWLVLAAGVALGVRGFGQTEAVPATPPAGSAAQQDAAQIGSSNAVVAPAAAAPAPDSPPDVAQNSVVKIFSTQLYPNPYQPWNKGTPTDVSGSGVVMEGHRILTNAHVVLYGTDVQVQGSQSGDKISATVEAIAPGIDLAVLKLDDEKFFDSHPPLPRATALPEVKDPVMVYGYPKGGDALSITKGIVSRIEFAFYYFSVAGLRIQIDAAINPGNSGGAAVVDGKMIGMAFSRLGDSENIGYIIPSEEIELFLQGVRNGGYHGKPAIYDQFQTLESPALRASLKLPETVEGMVVHKPFSADPAYPLKQWDVLTKVGDTAVDDQGMVKVNDNLHVRFTYLVQKFAKDGKVPLTVMRAGSLVQVELPVLTQRPLLIPFLAGAYPSYFIYGPLAFSSASREYLDDFLKTTKAATILTGLMEKGSPLVTRMNDQPDFDGERPVLISSPLFPSKLSEGYGNPMASVVKSVDGIPVKNLPHLVELLRDGTGDFVSIGLADAHSETLVFRRSEIAGATDEILTNNGIRNQGSPDVMAVWNEKQVK